MHQTTKIKQISFQTHEDVSSEKNGLTVSLIMLIVAVLIVNSNKQVVCAV